MSVGIAVYRHFVRHQRIQSHHFVFAVSDNLGIGVAPQKQMRHEGFPEHKRTHLRVRFIMKQQVQRMVDGFFLATALRISVEVKRKTSHRFCENAHTGIHRRHLHGRAFRHGFAGSCPAKVETVAASCGAVLRLIAGFE